MQHRGTEMNNRLVHINEAQVRELLDWDKTFEAVEKSMESVATGRAFQNARAITQIPNSTNFLYTMPGFLADKNYGALGCKLVSHFPNNPNRPQPLPYVLAHILLLDADTGDLKAVLAGTDITNWRTAAASAVATKHLHGGSPGRENNVLAVMGAGVQGRIHAVAFQHFFKFKEVRIWNRTPERAKKLADALNQEHNTKGLFVAYDSAEKCVTGADVIVTATTGEGTLVKRAWLKKGVHMNAIAVNPKNRELDDDTYKASDVYVDNLNGARSELGGINKLGVEFKGQIGDLITGKVPPPLPEAMTVFQSLGMAVEDCAMARLIYDLHITSAL